MSNKTIYVVISLVLVSTLCFFYWVYSESSRKANEYLNNKSEIINKIESKNGIEESIYEANNYIAALWWVDKSEKSKNLYRIIDSLRTEKIESIENIDKAIEVTKEYAEENQEEDSRRPSEYKSKNFHDKLFSLKVKKIKNLSSKYEDFDAEEVLGLVKETISLKERVSYDVSESLMENLYSAKRYASLIEDNGGFYEMKEKSISMCDDRTYEAVSSIGGADLETPEAKIISKLTYEVDGFGNLNNEGMDGSGPFGGIKDRPVTCIVSWKSGNPRITYFDF